MRIRSSSSEGAASPQCTEPRSSLPSTCEPPPDSKLGQIQVRYDGFVANLDQSAQAISTASTNEWATGASVCCSTGR